MIGRRWHVGERSFPTHRLAVRRSSRWYVGEGFSPSATYDLPPTVCPTGGALNHEPY
jgi:hypothetical protein